MDDSNFVGAVSALEGWAAFEWDLLRMDKWADRNLMKFKARQMQNLVFRMK